MAGGRWPVAHLRRLRFAGLGLASLLALAPPGSDAARKLATPASPLISTDVVLVPVRRTCPKRPGRRDAAAASSSDELKLRSLLTLPLRAPFRFRAPPPFGIPCRARMLASVPPLSEEESITAGLFGRRCDAAGFLTMTRWSHSDFFFGRSSSEELMGGGRIKILCREYLELYAFTIYTLKPYLN